MENLKLYVIDIDYIEYLRKYDAQVMTSRSDNYITERKYLGVVLNLGEFKYFAPLSSPKESDYLYSNGKKIVRKSIIPLIRLVNKKGELLGRVKLNNMIPVPAECLKIYNVDGEQNRKYKDLVIDEIICIRKNKAKIMKNAKVLYNQKVNGYKEIKYLNSTVDFKNIEKYCILYNKDEK